MLFIPCRTLVSIVLPLTYLPSAGIVSRLIVEVDALNGVQQ